VSFAGALGSAIGFSAAHAHLPELALLPCKQGYVCSAWRETMRIRSAAAAWSVNVRLLSWEQIAWLQMD
jgi:hypothetical protein